MKRLGLIGGIGPDATVLYYKGIIDSFIKRNGGSDYPEFIIHSINLPEMFRFINERRYDQLATFLIERAQRMERCGVDILAFASNTPHLVMDTISKQIDVPIISIVEETCKTVTASNLSGPIGLFGTKFTMGSEFYENCARRYGFEIKVPSHALQEFIHNRYMTEILSNSFKAETKDRLIETIESLVRQESINGLILGGTELQFILNQADVSQVKLFDSTEIHIKAIVNQILEK